MAEAFKCDRCEKFINGFPEAADDGSKFLKIGYAYINCGRFDKFYHLCNDCNKKLIEFLASSVNVAPPALTR